MKLEVTVDTTYWSNVLRTIKLLVENTWTCSVEVSVT